jgi:hypothetical protein
MEDGLISWNQASLLKFWQLLLDLQKSGALGALGISLHTAKPTKSNSNDRNDRRNVVVTTNSASTSLPQVERRRRCSAVDYFKIYHDAARTFYVRKALDSWSYFGPDNRKVRMLKGARFLLLDEVSAPILVC